MLLCGYQKKEEINNEQNNGIGTYKVSVDITSGNGVNKKYTVYASTQAGTKCITKTYDKSIFNNYAGNYTLKLTAYNLKGVKLGNTIQKTTYIN